MSRSWTIAVLILLALGWGAGGCSQVRPIGEFGKSMVDYFTGNTPIRAVARMEDRYFADERRQGINRLVDRDYGRRPPYTERYQQIAQYDSDHLVRATAIRALNRSRDATATPIFMKALEDPNPLVRQEAAKALGNMPDAGAVPLLIRLVNNAEENRDVRIAAADALRHHRQIDVARTLANVLGGRDFAVAWQARRSLVAMTGQDLRYDNAAWLKYLTGPDQPFS